MRERNVLNTVRDMLRMSLTHSDGDVGDAAALVQADLARDLTFRLTVMVALEHYALEQLAREIAIESYLPPSKPGHFDFDPDIPF